MDTVEALNNKINTLKGRTHTLYREVIPPISEVTTVFQLHPNCRTNQNFFWVLG
jgi:hypothetical protein